MVSDKILFAMDLTVLMTVESDYEIHTVDR